MSKKRRAHKSDERTQPHKQSKGTHPSDGIAPAKWSVVVLEVAKSEGRKILSNAQYDHIVDVLKRLVDFGDREQLSDLRIERIRSFYELKEKGGILGRINLRVYFGLVPDRRELVIAMTYKKEDEGRVPSHITLQVEDRLESYRHGRAKEPGVVYQEVSRGQSGD